MAIMPLADLPTAVVQAVTHGEAGWRYVVLLGNGGRRFWEVVQEQWPDTADPLDDFSTAVAQTFSERFLPPCAIKWLYPTPLDTTADTAAPPVPLQQLGEAAGWAHPSPLGLGISPEFGLWFAYRAAFLLGEVSVDLPTVRTAKRVSPCETCVTRPCVSACPAGAVRSRGTFDVGACSQERLRTGSGCATQCLARLACPIAPQHRYNWAQIAYHYGLSLKFLQAWLAEGRVD